MPEDVEEGLDPEDVRHARREIEQALLGEAVLVRDLLIPPEFDDSVPGIGARREAMDQLVDAGEIEIVGDSILNCKAYRPAGASRVSRA